MTDGPRPDDQSHPCAECGRPAMGLEAKRSGAEWITQYYCGTHSAIRERAWREGEIRGMSRDLSWTPEEFMGREGHTLMLGGMFARTRDDPEATPELALWCARVLEICSDLPLRKALQRQYLSPDELEAAAHYFDDFF